MILTLTGRHLELSPAVRKQVERKVARLERLLKQRAISAQCVLTEERQRFVCEVTLHAKGDHMLVGIAKHARLLVAVGEAVDKVSHQAQKLLDRWKTRRRTSASVKELPAFVEEIPTPPVPKIIVSRRYNVRAMTVMQAAAVLESGNQPFLVFRHPASDAVAVIHRRPDGQLGLIETER